MIDYIYLVSIYTSNLAFIQKLMSLKEALPTTLLNMTTITQAYKTLEQQMATYYRFDTNAKHGLTLIRLIDMLKEQLIKIDITVMYNIGIGMRDLHYCMEEHFRGNEETITSYIAFHMQDSHDIDDQLTTGSDVITIRWCYYSTTTDQDLFDQIRNVLPPYVTMDDYVPNIKLIMRIDCEAASRALDDYVMIW